MLKSVCLHINNACNLRCSHCWSDSGPYGKNKLEVFDVLNFVKAVASFGVERISLSGGEPLLHPDILEVAKAIIKLNIRLVITTNGTSHRNISEFLECLTEYQKSFVEFRVSIDGPKEICDSFRGEGVFDKAIMSLDYLKNVLGVVKINCVIGELVDITEWGTFLQQLNSLGIDELALMSLSPRGRGKEFELVRQKILSNIDYLIQISMDMNLTFNILRWDYITLDNVYVLVEHNGKILLPGVTDENDILIGDIKNLDIADLKKQIISKRKVYV